MISGQMIFAVITLPSLFLILSTFFFLLKWWKKAVGTPNVQTFSHCHWALPEEAGLEKQTKKPQQ